MSEAEQAAFRKTYEFYSKWRDTVIETEEQWAELAQDVQKIAGDADKCSLLSHLLLAALDALNDLYKNGMKPVPASYFGRDDL